MNWNKTFKIYGFVGATVCGVCLAKTCTKLTSTNSAVCAESSSDEKRPSERQHLKGRKGLTLKQVHVYFRHGARTPIHLSPGLDEVTYSQDLMLRTPPHFNFNHQVLVLPDLRPRETSEYETLYMKTRLQGGGYAGNLTTYGQQQMYNLGLQLRRSYVDVHRLLTTGYGPEDVYVRSTNIDRTIVSARCVMAGLFGTEELNKNGPVSIPVSETHDEVLFPNPHVCGVVKKANHAAMVHFDNIPGIKDDRQIMERVLGYKSGRPLHFVFLRDDLIARKTHGYAIPEHIRPYMDMIEHNATKILYYAMCGQHDAERPVVTRLAAGPALNLMLQGMEKMKRGDKTHKLCLYSTHDSTTVALLEALGLFDWKWPPFAADVRVELYEDERGEHWVRALYLGEEKTMRGCSGPVCRFSEFQKSLEPYVIARGPEFDQICSSKILEQIAALQYQDDSGEEETPEMKQTSETPAGM